ncbi:MAG: MBL fold metallo-hydrolase [Candidatus Yanofskybacteria bacterium]|nr:MBL fold metallo-hydrolase [Candidatus Yanofskybacteria bacterium]
MTGANYLLEHSGIKILVDCGLNQGTKYAEDLNYGPFSYDPKEIDYIFVTHSHIDHVGRLPKLYKDGFRGKVYATTATKDLIEVALPDNLSKIFDEARQDGHEPLFTKKDVVGLMGLVEGRFYKESIKLEAGIVAVLHDAGHILGSAIIEFRFSDEMQRGGDVAQNAVKKIYFSGDLGNPPTPLLMPTEKIKDADFIVVESAYGDRVHEARQERRERLTSVIIETVGRGGVLMVPSFAVERTQEFLYTLNELFNENRIPRVPVFIDSPLAVKMTEVYRRHPEYLNKATTYLINSGDDVFNFPELTVTLRPEDSKAINGVPPPKIIIAGSGMSQGGRIIHHELRYLSDPNSTILFIGYQVDGSLGRRIQRGESPVRILGQEVPVRCHLETISSYSAHADQSQLLQWVAESTKRGGGDGRLKKVFVVQGEEQSAKTFANLIRDNLGVEAVAPVDGDSFEMFSNQ